MTDQIARRPLGPADETRPASAATQHRLFRPRLAYLARKILGWIAHSRQRQALAELAARDDRRHLPKHGVAQDEASRFVHIARLLLTL